MAAILGMLGTWPEGDRLTWDEMVVRTERMLAHRWTRQTLEANTDIKAAYHRCRDAIRGPARSKPVDPAEVVQARRLESLKAEIDSLKRKVTAFEEVFVRHQYNAHKWGKTPSQLDAPIPPVDRRRSDV